MRPAWVAVLSDGGVLVEADGRTWDDIPRDTKIRRLEIRDLDGGATFVSLEEFDSFFMFNESVARAGQQGIPSAKVIGGIKDGVARLVRLEYQWSNEEWPAAGVPKASLRSGV